MNTEEHKIYLKEFSAMAEKILSSQKDTTDFLVKVGINTPTGRLTKAYSNTAPSLGYVSQRKKK